MPPIVPLVYHRLIGGRSEECERITGIETYPVWGGERNYLFVVVDTDEGIYGIGEDAALLTTDYPPGFLRWMSFRDHVWAATLHGVLAASLGVGVPGIPVRDRRALLGLASMPTVLSALSDTQGR